MEPEERELGLPLRSKTPSSLPQKTPFVKEALDPKGRFPLG
ncbi:MAG: hypothetical protein ACUVS9_02390 [Thermaceae bacterium]